MTTEDCTAPRRRRMRIKDLFSLLMTLTGIALCLAGSILALEYHNVWAPALVAGGFSLIVLASEISE